MPSIGYCLHLPNMVAVGLETIRNGEIFWMNNNREETRFFTSLRWFSSENPNIRIKAKFNDHLIAAETILWPSPDLSIPCFYLVILLRRVQFKRLIFFLPLNPLKYVAPRQYYSPCATDLQRAIFTYFLLWSFFISRKTLDQEPFDDTQGFKLATDQDFIWSVYGS